MGNVRPGSTRTVDNEIINLGKRDQPKYPPIHPLDQKELAQSLSELLSWQKASAYNYYLIDLPQPRSLIEDVGAQFPQMVGNKIGFNPYFSSATQAISLTVPYDMDQSDIPDNRDKICVMMDGFAGRPVPVLAAQLFSASFAGGLLSHFILETLAILLSKALPQAGNISFEFPVVAVDIPEVFSKGRDFGNSANSYRTHLSDLLASRSLQAAGTLWGWKAGGELLKLKATSDRRFFDATLALIRHRFSFYDIGQIVGYTLHFIYGFASTSIVIASGGKNLKDTEILDALKDNKQVAASRTLLTAVFSLLTTQFAAMVTSKGNQGKNNYRDAVDKYRMFLMGWHQGSLQNADDLFVAVYRIGYGIGYRDGFQDGYAKGYAAGYKDGYAAGFKDAWDAALKAVAAVAGSDTDVWGTISDIAEIASAVIAVIAVL